MAQSIEGRTLHDVQVGQRAHPALWKFRLALGWTILFGALIGLFALSWDIQWHSAVGRDRTLTMPHLFILGSIIVMGLTALAAVLIETRWAQRNPLVAQRGTRFAGIFSSTPGAYLVGYGALDAAVAFPIDQYWHTLYGVDVAIWAPFHIMAIAGFCVTCLGVTEMLVSGAHLAAERGAKRAAFAGYAGVIIALATLMGLICVLLPDSLKHNNIIALNFLTFTVFPLMYGAFGMFVLTIAIRALPWRGMASCVALVYAFFGLVNFLLIPPLMNWLLGVEQQPLRQNAPTVSVLAVQWQYGLVAAAVLLDVMLWLARRRGWSVKKTNWTMVTTGIIGMSIAALAFPAFLVVAQAYSNPPRIRNLSGSSAVIARAASSIPHTNPVLIVVISLAIGVGGVLLGYWFGTGFGQAMRKEAPPVEQGTEVRA